MALYLDIKINWKTIYTIRAVRVVTNEDGVHKYEISVLQDRVNCYWTEIGHVMHDYSKGGVALSMQMTQMLYQHLGIEKVSQNNELKLAKELFRDELS